MCAMSAMCVLDEEGMFLCHKESQLESLQKLKLTASASARQERLMTEKLKLVKKHRVI